MTDELSVEPFRYGFTAIEMRVCVGEIAKPCHQRWISDAIFEEVPCG